MLSKAAFERRGAGRPGEAGVTAETFGTPDERGRGPDHAPFRPAEPGVSAHLNPFTCVSDSGERGSQPALALPAHKLPGERHNSDPQRALRVRFVHGSLREATPPSQNDSQKCREEECGHAHGTHGAPWKGLSF
ncbi:hypothetical protein AAFF_G00104800 [Aldrovandia affinis]|uniref:Uncharacterized protein n=1 Tax=Aldrovandia affinis TaxID=143900 RepID=A0AAD7T211_9TELE|nr:hypothetical protein AAFF_G00104800 [Aldrovandia affinis]